MNIKTHKNRSCTVQSKPHMSEFEIQAFLYHMLNSLGYFTRGEVMTRHNRHRKNGRCTYSPKVKFDLVVFSEPFKSNSRKWRRKAVRIIEVKAGKSKVIEQVHRYAEWGVSIDVIRGYGEARRYIDGVSKLGCLPNPKFVPVLDRS